MSRASLRPTDASPAVVRRLLAVHAFHLPGEPTCFAWCASSPSARVLAEMVLTESSGLASATACRDDARLNPCERRFSLPLEAGAADSVGFVCLGVTITRAVCLIDESGSVEETVAQRNIPHHEDAPRAPLASITVTLSEAVTAEVARTVLHASAWWLTRPPSATGMTQPHLVSHRTAASVLLSLHGATALAGFLWAVRDAHTSAATARAAPPPSGGSTAAALMMLVSNTIVSVRIAHVAGSALRALAAPCSAAPAASEEHTADTDAWNKEFALLAIGCRALTCLHIESCSGWCASWCHTWLWRLLPRLTELSLSGLDVCPRVVPNLRAWLSSPPPAMDGHALEHAAMPHVWSLRALRLRHLRNMTTLSALLLARLFFFPRFSATDVSGDGRLSRLVHLTIEYCDLQPVHIVDEAARWLATGNSADNPAAEAVSEPEDGKGHRPASVCILESIRAEVEAVLSDNSAAISLDAGLLNCFPLLRTFVLLGVNGRPLVDRARTNSAPTVPDTVRVPRHVPLRACTVMYSAFYPLQALLTPTAQASEGGTDCCSEGGSDSESVVEECADDTVPTTDPEKTVPDELAHDRRGSSAGRYPCVCDCSHHPLATALSHSGTFRGLEALHFDGVLLVGPGVAPYASRTGHSTMWRRLHHLVEPLRALSMLHTLELAVYFDDFSLVSPEQLGVCADGEVEDEETSAMKEREAAREVWSFSWLDGCVTRLESLQLLNVLPLATPRVAEASLAHLLATFSQLRRTELCWTGAPLPHWVGTAVSGPADHAAWGRAAITDLSLQDVNSDTGVLAWHDKADKYALSRLASLRRVDVSAPLLTSTNGAPCPCAPVPDAFRTLETILLTNFTARYGAVLEAVPHYPQLRHVHIAFARGTGVHAADAEALAWLTHAPLLTTLDLAACDADPLALVEDAGLTEPERLASAEAWWAQFFAPISTRRCLKSLVVRGFTHLQRLPDSLSALSADCDVQS